MKVKELIEYLKEYCNENDHVSIVEQGYDGGSFTFDTKPLAVVVGYDWVTLCPEDVYHIRYASDNDKTFCVIYPDGKIVG